MGAFDSRRLSTLPCLAGHGQVRGATVDDGSAAVAAEI